MTSAEVRKEYCKNCREVQEVKDTPCGRGVLLKCMACHYWIRCPDCTHVMAARGHDCPRKKEAIPS